MYSSTARYANEPPDFANQCAAGVWDETVEGNYRRCKQRAARGRAVCRFHGGASPSGIAHGSYKDGRYVRAGRFKLSGAMQERYDWYLANHQDLLESWDEISLLLVRIQDLLDRTNAEDGATINRELFRAWDAFWVAQAGGNVPRMRETLETLRQAVERARDNENVYTEIYYVIDLLRRTRAVETRRIVAEKETMNADQARIFLNAVQQTVIETCKLAGDREIEKTQRNYFAERIHEILNTPIVG